MKFALLIGGLLCLAVSLPAPAPAAVRVESEDEYVARIAKDIVLKMVSTAAYDDLRSTVCPSEAARQRIDAVVLRVLDCGNYRPSGQASAPRMLAERKTAVDTAQGVWTTKGRDSCGKSYYAWTVASKIGMSEFTDQSGQIDIERTLEFTDTTILTETLSSYHPIDGRHEKIGTKWQYVFLDQDRVQVRNMRTGSVFYLTRCN